MARITVEDCLEKVTNRFKLVHLVAERTKQLRRGAKPFLESPENKDVVRALREVAAGKVSFENIADLAVTEEDIFDRYRAMAVREEYLEEYTEEYGDELEGEGTEADLDDEEVDDEPIDGEDL